MDGTKLILSEVLSAPVLSGNTNKADAVSEQKKTQAAKDFESVLLGRLLDEMKNSIGDWGFEESTTANQIQGTFWMFLASHLANSGGLGIWKDIYKSLPAPEPVESLQAERPVESLKAERQTYKIDEAKPRIDGII